jgi:DNA-binding CsgD family transcriptional regulator
MPDSARRPDPIRLIEAGYAWEADESRWIEELTRSAAPFGVGGGVIAYTVRVEQRVQLGRLHCSAGTRDRDAVALRRVVERLPSPIASSVFAPTEFVGNAAYRISRLARSAGVAPESLLRADGTPLPANWSLISGDATTRALVLCFPRSTARGSSPDEPFPHRDARALGLVGAHLGSALRLRTLLGSEGRAPEAVLTPGGKLVHAEGAATAPRARNSLVAAVQSSERARGRMRRAAPDEALRSWAALVQGRWTIIDTVERDGKRLLLARANPMRTAGILDLTPDERDVAWLAALGHSYKYIAYELGHPLSTVASRLRRAMHKLRAGSRAELLARIGQVRAS